MESDLRDYILNTLPSERWFATKSKAIKDAALMDSLKVSVSGLTFVICLVRIDFDSGSDVYMLYLLESDSGNGRTYENALGNTVFVNYLYNIFKQSASQVTNSGMISGENLSLDDSPFSKFSSIKLHAGEQSNSSVILDRKRIMKVYRRKTDYFSPDYQLPKAFMNQTDFKGTPECYGSITYSSGDDVSLIATVFQFIENEGDCWDYFTRILNASIEANGLGQDVLAEEIGALAKLTAQMHNSLSSLSGENFAPVPLTLDDLSAWLTGLTNNASLLSQYSRTHPGIPGYDAIFNQARSILSSLSGSELVKTRIHGDYHLGQILKSGSDFYVIDFEGEPMRSLEYRRLRQSPARDVAGMLRSIHYASSFCTMNIKDSEIRERGAKWAEMSSERFISAYMASLNLEVPFMPEDHKQFRLLLDFFILDKALYEFNYEINNRPTWVGIPLDAISGIVSGRD